MRHLTEIGQFRLELIRMNRIFLSFKLKTLSKSLSLVTHVKTLIPLENYLRLINREIFEMDFNQSEHREEN